MPIVNNLPPLISFAELLSTEWPEEVFIEGGLLSRGDSMMIGAESKAGKSTLLMTLVRQLLIGGEFLGFKVIKPLKVLLMQAEIRESRLKERIISKFSSINSSSLQTSYTWNTRGQILLDRDLSKIKSSIELSKPDVLILDPFINFHTASENDATQITNVFRKLDAIKEEFNIALIISQHFRKLGQSKDSLLESIRGSTAFRGWAVTTIALEGRTTNEYRRLEFDIRNNDQPIRRIIKYNRESKEFDWHDPLAIVLDMLRQEMQFKELAVNQVIGLIISKCGHIVGKKRERAFQIKDLLVNSQMLSSREDGKRVLISVHS